MYSNVDRFKADILSRTLPISQYIPVNPDWQLHWYELIWSTYVPCRHGELRHSSTSEKMKIHVHIVDFKAYFEK